MLKSIRHLFVAIAILFCAAVFVLVRSQHTQTTPPAAAARPVPTVSAGPIASAALPPVSTPSAVAATNNIQSFADWLERFNGSDAVAGASMVERGVQLAQARRTEMKALIRTDPEAALALSVPAESRTSLPSSISSLLEKAVREVGNFTATCVTPMRGLEELPYAHSVTIKGRTFTAHVYGGMAQMPSLQNVALEGVALDDDFALADIPRSRLRAFGDSSVGSSDVTGRPVPGWAAGPKRVLIIRVDFPDLQGEPVYLYNTNIVITTNYVYNLFNQSNGIADFFRQNSYSNTDLILGAADVTPVYRMPSNAVWYAAGDGSRFYGAEMQAVAYADAANDYDVSQYDIIGLVHTSLYNLPGSLMSFAGQGSIGGKYIFINGAFDFSVVAHEIGHTYGVFHANRWKPTDGTIIGPESDMTRNMYNGALSAVSIEYGDGSDIMGVPEGSSGQFNLYHLNHWFKNILGWIPDTAVQTVTTSGVYRVYRADTGGADRVNHKLALKICRDIIRDYWIGYRRLETNGINLANGATIEFGYNENRAAELLVCNTPRTTWTNAALTVGQSLTDTNAGITFTTLAQGGAAPDEYLDVQVSMQPRVSFSSNLVVGLPWQGQATVAVDRLGGSSGTTTVQYLCLDSNAVAGVHYTPISGSLTWGPGDASSRTVNIPILPYTAASGQHDLIVRLTNIVNGVIINPGDCVVSLRPAGNAALDYHVCPIGGATEAIALQPDGKIIVGGNFTSYGSGVGTDNSAKNLGRLLPNGQRDYTFKSLPGGNFDVLVIKRQPDGKILVGGYFTTFGGLPRMRMARLLQDGSIDTNFIPPDFNSAVYAINLLPDGKIFVGGSFNQVTNAGVAFSTRHGVCLNADGSLNYLFTVPSGWSSSFQVGGFAIDNYSRTNDWVYYSASADSRFNFTLSRTEQKGVTRRFSNGTLDTNFNAGNVGADNAARCLAVQPDGKILAGGDFVNFNGAPHSHIVRLNYDGSVDTNFTASIDGPYVFSILVQPDGKIIVGGWFNNVNGVANTNLVRLNTDGSLDPTWDNGTGALNGSSSSVESMELMPDGRVMVSALNGHIRNAFSAPFYTYATEVEPLYTGVTNLPGQATFSSTNSPGFANGTVNIPVQRMGGAGGIVQMDYGTQDDTAIAGTDYTTAKGTLTWADGDTAPKTVSVNVNPSATGARTFKLNLGIPNAILAGTNQQVIVTIYTNLTYAMWRTLKFDGSQQTNDSISGVMASPAGDGVQNLLKYAFDLAPFLPVTTNLPSATLAGNRLRIDFRRDPIRTDLIYEVLAGNDLTNLSAIARSANGAAMTNINALAVSDTPTNSLRRVVVDDSAAITNTPVRFMQLKLSKP